MAREAKRELVGESVVNGVKMVSYKCPFEDANVEKDVTVTVPADAVAFQAFIAQTAGDDLTTQYDRWLNATITAAKAKLREAVAAESTIVKRDGKDVNVLSMRSKEGMDDPANVKIACAVINAAYMQSNAFGWDGQASGKGTSAPQGAFVVARRKLVEAKKATLRGEGAEHQRMVVPV